MVTIQEISGFQENYIFWKVTLSDIISFINLIVMIWIAYGIQKTQTRDRFLREHFISEVKSINEDYQCFFKQVMDGELSANDIKIFLKIISVRIGSMEKILCKLYKIKSENIKPVHAEFQQYITGLDEFNNQYNNEKVVYSTESKNKILEQRQKIIDCMTMRIIDINSARKRCKYRIQVKKMF